MRRAAKVDANQPAVVAYLRKLGWSVVHLHRLGQDIPDLLVGKRMGGKPWACLLELKVPGGKLTKGQAEFAEEWLGPIAVATGPEDAAAQLLSTWRGWP